MTVPVTNIFNNPAMITTKGLDILRNDCSNITRMARRWDKDFSGSTKIGNTLSIRQPGFRTYRSGAVAVPQGFNDSFSQITLQQGGCDIELTGAEMTLNINDFNREVTQPAMSATVEAISVQSAAMINGWSQFAGSVSADAPTDLKYFLDAKATMKLQSAVHEDGKLHGFMNPRQEAGMVNGLKSILTPIKDISELWQKGSLGGAYGYEFFSSANVPAFTLGTWSGTLTVTSTTTTQADGSYSTITIAGQTGAFAVGECLTIAGCNAVNPASKVVTPDLKQMRVRTSTNGSITVTPGLITSGPLQNCDALPLSTAAIYPWGFDAATALTAGTGQHIKTSAAYHEDALAFAMADLEDMSMVGAKTKRMVDDETGLRLQMSWGYDPINYKGLLRLDLLWAVAQLRPGFGTRVVSL